MLKIRRFIPSDIKKLAQKIEFIEPANVYSIISDRKFTFFPLSLFNDSMPLNMRFLEQNYVAVNKGELLGLIGLMPDNKHNTRWRINRLILDQNNLDIGKQLVNYVVNKYGGAGVQSFITALESMQTETIALFQNGCGFRYLSEIDIWKLKSNDVEKIKLDGYKIREIRSKDAEELLELDTFTLYPQFRVSLKKSKNDYKISLKNSLLDYLRKYNPKKLVFINQERNEAEGFITIYSKDNLNFYVDILLSITAQDYYEHVISYISSVINSTNSEAIIYIYERKYYQSSAKLKTSLINLKFEKDKNFKLLVKDYWKPILTTNENKKSSFIILPDITSPACKKF
ncbi:MAG: hypothetical protein WCK67_03815 [bacterium]